MGEVEISSCSYSFLLVDFMELGEEYLLVKDVQAGNTNAFNILVQKHERLVYSVCLRITNDQADARDITQDAFVTAFQKIKTFKGKSKFSTWLVRIAVNLSLKQRRRRSRHNMLSLDTYDAKEKAEIEKQITSQSKEDSMKNVLEKETKKFVLEAIETLSPNHRSAIVLHGLQGYSYREVSEILDCPVGTVMSRLSYAKRILKEKLRPDWRAAT